MAIVDEQNKETYCLEKGMKKAAKYSNKLPKMFLISKLNILLFGSYQKITLLKDQKTK